jgi:hypothetical protein
VVGSNEGLSIITSGGGFSYIATRPTWQSTHVAAYLAQSGLSFPPTTTYNTNGTSPTTARTHVRAHTHTHTAHSCTDVCVVVQEGVIRMSACWVTTTESPTQARLEPTHLTYGRTVLLILFSEPNHNNFTRAQWVAMDGTSASAPAFAGMITLINQMRKSAYVHNKRHTRHTPHTPHTTHATHTHTQHTHTHNTHTHTRLGG